jgi:hypothetical protein
MTSNRNERIRIRAHEIWEREGRPEGRQAEHWEQAEREIESETGGEQQDGSSGLSAVSESGGLSSTLQPGGTIPGGGPGAGQGSIGTGGGSTRGRASGGAKRSAKRTG